MSSTASFKRVLVKLSGESLVKEGNHSGIESDACKKIAQSIKDVHDKGVEIGLVIGAGNLFRGRSLIKEMNIPRAKADSVGMMATLLNGLVLQQAFINLGCPCAVLSAFPVGSLVEEYSLEKTLDYLNSKTIVIFVGGTGHPYFSTDTAASLRACEIEADALLKATKVDGVYSADPKIDSKATKFDSLTYLEALEKNLKVMDATAISLCRENELPIVVFDMYQKDNLSKVVQRKKCGTVVYGD
ncbi:MAG: Uridylate kinase [Chlamydiae bacterium]|nr:Uridylate kinase [Chlamydiota bacterium]